MKQKFSFGAVEINGKCYKIMGRKLIKVNLSLYNPATKSLAIYSNALNFLYTKNLHMNVCRNFIHNCPNLEVIKMPVRRWMDKQTVYHMENRKWFSNKKKWTKKSWKKTRRNLKCNTAKWKKPIWKRYGGNSFNYIAFWKS